MKSYKFLKCTNEYKRYILQGIHRPSLTNNVSDAFIASEVFFYVVNITLIENVTIIVIKQNCNAENYQFSCKKISPQWVCVYGY